MSEQVDSVRRERLLAQTYDALRGWLKENAPGGWIDDLRVQLAAERQQHAALRKRIETIATTMRTAGRFREAPGGSDVVTANRIDEWADDLAVLASPDHLKGSTDGQ